MFFSFRRVFPRRPRRNELMDAIALQLKSQRLEYIYKSFFAVKPFNFETNAQRCRRKISFTKQYLSTNLLKSYITFYLKSYPFINSH